MLKFFRKIRQRLLSENKFSKYLIYAIGEIILVVVGILVALQVNNLNEQNKLKSQEIEILESIMAELEDNLGLASQALKVNIGLRNSIDILLNHLEEDKPYHDSLNFHFAYTTVYYANQPASGSYETLKAKGVDIISNIELRGRIIHFFEWNSKMMGVNANRYYNLLDEANINIYNTRFLSSWDFERMDENMTMIPRNYESLKTDKIYIYFLKSLRGKHYWQIFNTQRLYIKHTEITIGMIKEELSKYNE